MKVFALEAPETFDGLSGWAGEIPVVVVNALVSADRKRLTTLHELAHLLLKFGESFSPKAVERLCHKFVGALLMPKDVFVREFGGKRVQVSVNELCDLKLRYGISIAAIMARAKDLGLVTQEYSIRFNRRSKACRVRKWWPCSNAKPGSRRA